jgi:putative selenium metabolism hydrolase
MRPIHDDAARAPVGPLAFLQEIVRLESTPGREEAVVGRIVDEMRRLGYDDAYVDEAGNAVGRVGHGSPVLLIDSHIDTIPMHSPGQWTHDPRAGTIADGRIWGLGTCDMKGSAAASVYGVAQFAAGGTLTGTIYVVCSIAEEMMEGAALRTTVEACAPDVVVIGEPTDLRVCNGQRGRAKIEADVLGRACHAGHPTVGLNAAERAAEVISAVARLPHPTHPELGVRSITCIDVHSEPYPSVSTVPDRCRVRFDARFGPDDTAETLTEIVAAQARVWDALEERPGLDVRLYTAEFQTYTGRRYTVPEFAPAWYTDPDSTLVRTALEAVGHAAIEPRLATYRFCTNGSLTAGTLGIPTIGFGVGREEDAHTVDESIELAKFDLAVAGFRSLAAELTARSPAELAAA